MRLLHSASTHPLGVDISDSSIKLIQLNKTRRFPVLQAAAVAELPEGFVVAGIIKNKTGLAKQLRAARQNTLWGRFSGSEVVVALPEQKTFTKVVTVTSAGRELETDVTAELEKELPYTLNEVCYDWQVVKKHAHSQDVIVSAAPLRLAEDYREVCAAAELTPVALEPEALATARALLPLQPVNDATSIILDIGSRHSSFIACANGAVLYTVSIPFSGHGLSKKIAAELNIAVPKADAAKIVSGLNSRYLDEVLDGTLQQKVKEALNYLHIHYPAHTAVEKVYLCGGGSALAGLAERVTETIHLPTVLANVFTNMYIKPSVERDCFWREYQTNEAGVARTSVRQSMAGRFSAAVGAALRGVLHPEI